MKPLDELRTLHARREVLELRALATDVAVEGLLERVAAARTRWASELVVEAGEALDAGMLDRLRDALGASLAAHAELGRVDRRLRTLTVTARTRRG